MVRYQQRLGLAALLALAACLALAVSPLAAGKGKGKGGYTVTPLVSDGSVPGTATDPNLVNAWGLVSGPTTPWWVADNGTNLSTVYNAAGATIPLVVSVPGGPTGLVFNGTPGTFPVGPANSTAAFIFDTEGGTIGGRLGATTVIKVDNSATGAVYKGLAIATTATGPQLYATNFGNGTVDVYDASWNPVQTAGGFVDPKLPKGFAPFGIQTIGSDIFVTFAKKGPGIDEVDKHGLGVVDEFDTSGNLLERVATHDGLNAPWGLAMAPASFGRFGGDLLVGNFGDGQINAYAQTPKGDFKHDGTLNADQGKLAIDGLWALQFGQGTANNGPTDTLFFTAGPNGENDGLFGTITAA
jgi:uncharacterized protein (TIGR03118 family)